VCCCHGVNFVSEQDVALAHVGKQQRHLGLVSRVGQDGVSNLDTTGRKQCRWLQLSDNISNHTELELAAIGR
jgi:hypothetical protein